MNNYSTIKELVIDTCASEGSFPSYEKLTNLVLQNFPNSKWKKTHYSWYKSKIKSGGILVPDFEGETNSLESFDAELEGSIEASLSLEKDLHSYLAKAVHEIEEGLVLIENGVEYQVDAGRIDLLASDKKGGLVVIELKAGIAKDAAIGQLLGYMGCLAEQKPENLIRGILVASEFDKRVVFAARTHPQIHLVQYKVAFELQKIT